MNKDELITAFRAIGLREGMTLEVHSSLSSFGLVEGGAQSVIDALMAAAMVGEGTGYAQLTYTCALNSEEYGVGFRKGSDLAAALNEFFTEAYADGSMTKAAETYGVQAAIIAQ